MAPEAPAKASAPAGRAAAPRGAARLVRWDVIVTALLIVVFAGGAMGTPDFATGDNLSFALDDLSEIALIALPMTLLVVAAEVDLSVASVLGLCSALFGALWDAGWAIQMIVPLLLVVGAVAGLVNGLLVTRLGLPSLAVTIGTLTLYRGLAYVVLGTKAVAQFPQNYADFAIKDFPGTPIPYPFALFILLAVVTAIVLHATGLGRALFAIGAQEEAAFFAGIRVKRIKLLLFVVSGVMAAFAGVVYTLRYGSARADNGLGLELAVIASVLLGGVDFDGGRGTLGGVVAGVLLIGLLRNLLMLRDVATEIQSIVTGLLLIVSVLTPRIAARVREARRHHHGSLSAPS
jgi:ribose/xylose/arabinose/galactoside ABC-type transport system permease subunit